MTMPSFAVHDPGPQAPPAAGPWSVAVTALVGFILLSGILLAWRWTGEFGVFPISILVLVWVTWRAGLRWGIALTIIDIAATIAVGELTARESGFHYLPDLSLNLPAFVVAIILAGKLREAYRTEADLKQNLARYVPASLAGTLASQGLSAASMSRRQKAAILFADVRGFTGIVEDMTPEAAFGLVAEYRRLMTACVAANGGTFDKSMGDGVLAIFGVPEERDDDAGRALQCGFDVQGAVASWNMDREKEGTPPIDVRVGIHYGDVMFGVMGDEERLEHSVIGDTVNTAARIEKLTRAHNVPMLVSAPLLQAAGAAAQLHQWEIIAAQPVRGRNQTLDLAYQAFPAGFTARSGACAAETSGPPGENRPCGTSAS